MTTTEQLERQAAQTREELARTIGRIEQRISPRRILADNPWFVVGAIGLAGGLVAWLASRGGGDEG